MICYGFLAASAAKKCEKEAVNQSAATAASPDYVKFRAVIKSAASAASQIQGTQVQGSAAPRRPALPWTWVPWIWKGALAADLITA